MSTILKTTLRIGRLRYVNAIPFYHQLWKKEMADLETPIGGIKFYENYPTQINLAMRKGKIDLAPISSLEYLNHQREYLLLPDLVIGSRDFSSSVLLISKDRIEGLNGAKIALTRQSLSSAVLFRILLKFKYKFHNQYVSVKASPE
ncbi:MAG: hypothetical protein NC930_00220, partial [Candidatus Omnitrophica bacterium]|nr:hypothetical protein [Candidatus Omnitrophota bacterium]